MRLFKQLNLVVLIVALILSISLHTLAENKTFSDISQAQPQKVVLGQIKLSFYQVTGAVIQEVLESLGYKVEVKEGAHEDIFPVLAKGDVDLLAAAWLPNGHGFYWEKYKDRAIELADLYEQAQLFWGVPDYVPESAVKSVADLTKPSVVARMNKTIQGIGPGAGIMMGSKKMMTEYKLNQKGYKLFTGTPKKWIDTFEKAVAAKRWVVIPLWQPQYLNRAYKIRPLLEPKKLLGGQDVAKLVAYKDFPSKFDPKTVAILRRINLGIDAVTEMDYMVNVGKKTPREAAKMWMAKNRSIVDSWMNTAKSEETGFVSPVVSKVAIATPLKPLNTAIGY